MATRSSGYASRGSLAIFWRRGVEKPAELPLTDSTTGKLLRLDLGPTAQVYGDGVESPGETWDDFFDDQGKIPAARNEDHSFKRGKSASYLWIGTTQLKQVKQLVGG